MHSEHNTQHTRECKLDVKFTRDEILWQRMNQSGKWETWIWMKRREEEREREKEKEDERDWNLQRVTSLLLVWLGGGIAGCGDGCELKSSKFMICKQISSTSLLISAITSLHRNLVPVTEKKKKTTSIIIIDHVEQTIFCEHSFFLFIGTQTDEYENRRKIRKVSKLTLLWNATQTRIITSMCTRIFGRWSEIRRETRKQVTAFVYEYWFPSIITEGIILGYVNLHKEIYFFIGGAVNATKPNRATGVWRDKYPRSTFEGIVY